MTRYPATPSSSEGSVTASDVVLLPLVLPVRRDDDVDLSEASLSSLFAAELLALARFVLPDLPPVPPLRLSSSRSKNVSHSNAETA
mmetsp:Transcript_32268/g.62229  ORF Transcript_32268/g.62229 Transcript_32268/m.62229 type:complete len:86 (-) Transcript_32268:539-796(-)